MQRNEALFWKALSIKPAVKLTEIPFIIFMRKKKTFVSVTQGFYKSSDRKCM